MFIKKVKKKYLNTDKNYFVFQLFEEVEVKGQKKFKMILSLGSKLNIPESKHQILADCIEAKARKKVVCDQYPDDIQILAEEFSKQLVAREHARRKRVGLKSFKKPTILKKRDLFQDEDNAKSNHRGLSLTKKPANNQPRYLNKKKAKSTKSKTLFFKK